MSLRFTDTRKWDDAWFESLSQTHKLIHQYLCDKCDVAGVWGINLRDLAFKTRATEDEWTTFLAIAGSERIWIMPGEKYLWLLKFIPFQYPRGLTTNNRVAPAIAKSLAKIHANVEVLPSPYQAPLIFLIENTNGGAYKPLPRPLVAPQDKDTEPDKDTDKDKEGVAERKTRKNSGGKT